MRASSRRQADRSACRLWIRDDPPARSRRGLGVGAVGSCRSRTTWPLCRGKDVPVGLAERQEGQRKPQQDPRRTDDRREIGGRVRGGQADPERPSRSQQQWSGCREIIAQTLLRREPCHVSRARPRRSSDTLRTDRSRRRCPSDDRAMPLERTGMAHDAGCRRRRRTPHRPVEAHDVENRLDCT